jgi:hypothetical protein
MFLEKEGNKIGVRFLSIRSSALTKHDATVAFVPEEDRKRRVVCNRAAEVASLFSGMVLEASLLKLIDMT